MCRGVWEWVVMYEDVETGRNVCRKVLTVWRRVEMFGNRWGCAARCDV